MNKKFSENVTVNEHEFEIHYYTEYDFTENFDPQKFEGWDGILEVFYNVPDGVAITSFQAEKILEEAKDELYKKAREITRDNPDVYGKFLLENNFQNRVSWSIGAKHIPQMLASKVKACFSLHKM